MVAPDAPVIFVNATVITLDAERPRAVALRLEGERITDVYTEPPGDDQTGTRVDLEGAVVLPGLTDAHLHIQGLGRASMQLDLVGTESADAVAAMVAEAVHSAPAGTWIRGRGWDQNDWAVQEFPTATQLDAVAPDHPVWLTRVDGHAIWVNSAAMALAGVDASTEAPAGGELMRDEAGIPTGIFVDSAIDLVADRLPAAEPAQVLREVEAGLARCREAGLTGAHDMGTSPAALEALRQLQDSGQLGLRVWSYLADAEDRAALPAPFSQGLLEVVGVKLFADGAMGSRGAALLEPYSDRPDSAGLLIHEPDELAAAATLLHAAGHQVTIHAIGDRGNRVALDAIAAAQGDDTSRRHRIEHAQVVHEDDWPRFAQLGVTASMQPTHATSDMPWAEDRLGPDRIQRSYAWRSLIESGAHLALGSDAPVESVNPFWGLYSAVARADHAGAPDGGWRMDQALMIDEALRGFTQWPASAVGAEGIGTIIPGGFADLTIVDRDPTAVGPEELLQVRVLGTIVAGRQVFRAD